jgi:hypothetical protein
VLLSTANFARRLVSSFNAKTASGGCQPDEDSQPSRPDAALAYRAATDVGHASYPGIFQAILQGLRKPESRRRDDGRSQCHGISATARTVDGGAAGTVRGSP